jgi:hypothetical protein
MSRRFPAPWRKEKIAGGYVLHDANWKTPGPHLRTIDE